MSRKDARPSNDGRKPHRETIARAPLLEERRVAAWIGASILIKGGLTSSEDLTIAGRVEGDVSVPSHTLVVASGARIRGNIVARDVAVHGDVRGTITASAKVEVGETGSVEGDILTPRMVVAEGAMLQGRLGISAPQPAGR